MQMAYQSKRLVRCLATRSYPRRKFTPASSTKPSAARWTNSPKPSAAQALASTEGKVRRRRQQPQRNRLLQQTLLYQHPQPQTYKHNKGARGDRAPCVYKYANTAYLQPITWEITILISLGTSSVLKYGTTCLALIVMPYSS